MFLSEIHGFYSEAYNFCTMRFSEDQMVPQTAR